MSPILYARGRVLKICWNTPLSAWIAVIRKLRCCSFCFAVLWPSWDQRLLRRGISNVSWWYPMSVIAVCVVSSVVNNEVGCLPGPPPCCATEGLGTIHCHLPTYSVTVFCLSDRWFLHFADSVSVVWELCMCLAVQDENDRPDEALTKTNRISFGRVKTRMTIITC